MTRIQESLEIPAAPRAIWNYVQDYHRRREWDVTMARFEPSDTEQVGKDARVFARTSGLTPMEYESIYVSYDPFKVSAVKMTRPIRNVPFSSAAGSWRYNDLHDGRREFTMRFGYEPGPGPLHRWLDKFLIEPAIQRGIRASLRNLQKHFTDGA